MAMTRSKFNALAAVKLMAAEEEEEDEQTTENNTGMASKACVFIV